MRTHTIDGLHVEVSGPDDGTPVVFGHSLLCDGRMWQPQVAELARDRRCVVLDLRGHGRSPAAPRGFTMADQGEDYTKVMDALGIQRAILVGLSMGAMAAMHFAARHPSRVAGLAFFNTSADRQLGRPRLIALGALARLVGMRPFLRKQALAEMFGPTFRRAHPEIVKVFDERFAALDVPGATRALTMVVDRPAALDLLPGIGAPTMIVAGEEDKATPPWLGRRILERMPHAEWHLLPCGHLSAVERPDEVSALLRSFVTRVSG
ncbi:MAG: alpha/beta fold hydrolase [Deltaproteobacteria bacterium]|nr:alpha/beta fold hydrolase [Deltaproteobacteria bacterium]